MSNVNIRRAIENIRSGTSVYTPIIETVVNAIQAIECLKIEHGLIEIIPIRERQLSLDDSTSPEITGFLITDNGIGFNNENRDSFDTLYSAHKINEGGKGFGRFTCLKYFDDVLIESTYKTENSYATRHFRMGKENEIIIDERISSTKDTVTGSKIKLSSIKNVKFPDRKLLTLARVLVEKLLPYFYQNNQHFPLILLREEDESERVTLNDFIEKQGAHLIEEIISASGFFTINSNLQEENFTAQVFKFYSPRSATSKISLVAHRREVTSTSLHKYIPEFIEEFYEKHGVELDKERNFIIKIYVFSEYLDNHVSLERGGFEFSKEDDALLGISQYDIESIAAEFARKAVDTEVDARILKKQQRVENYVKYNAPWHTEILKYADLKNLPYNAEDEQIEDTLQQLKYKQEMLINGEMKRLLATSEPTDLEENTATIVRKISETSKNDLVHYVALRRNIINLFKKNLETDTEGKYSSEGVVHDIIFPRRTDTTENFFTEHNLWMIDERLNFTEYLSSDLPLKGNSDRPDLIAYDRRVVFRGENTTSNPVTIFEFKKPQREDFVNPSSEEDPIQQIIRYVRKLKSGDFKTPAGREILISDNTPFYGYVVCDLTPKIKSWLEEEKDFKPMPDRLGYFKWHENLNLYIEVLSWDKILKDATMRNQIFFHKLGIN